MGKTNYPNFSFGGSAGKSDKPRTFKRHLATSPFCLDAACAAIESTGDARKIFWMGSKLKWHEKLKAAFENRQLGPARTPRLGCDFKRPEVGAPKKPQSIYIVQYFRRSVYCTRIERTAKLLFN
jgi:hypothetical protein